MLQDSARYALYLIRGIGIEPLRDIINGHILHFFLSAPRLNLKTGATLASHCTFEKLKLTLLSTPPHK